MAVRPRIGISLDTGAPDQARRMLELPDDYFQSVLRAGGLPVALPHTADHEVREAMIASLDALIIPGGRDVNPAIYGQPPHPSTCTMDPLRQAFDLAMLTLAQARQLPTLGICLGCQLMNVHRGGTLYQAIAAEFPESPVVHTRTTREDPANPTRSSFHDVLLRPGTLLFAIFGVQDIRTNSRHRQAVRDVGQGLVPNAYASDGILEGIEDPSLPFWLGVQWHPENLGGTEHEKLFAALVEHAAP